MPRVAADHRIVIVSGGPDTVVEPYLHALNEMPDIRSVSATLEQAGASPRPHLILAPVAAGMPGASLLPLFGAWQLIAPVLAILSQDVSPGVIDQVTARADDFLIEPLRADELRARVLRLLGRTRGGDQAGDRLIEAITLRELVGSAPALRQVVETIPRLANAGAPVLIVGETGTGKELCARALHHGGPRRANPFIAVDCSAIPDHLFESEFFGHRRGAFTDAHADRKGLAAMAHSGTLFLDEVDSLSPSAQSKLLRFLEDGTFKPLGAERYTQAEFGLIAATNCDLEQRVADRAFRSDLFYRLNVLRLRLPPLRERRDDIEMLANHFLDAFARQSHTPRKQLTPAALQRLMAHEWPGNVRELRNVVQRAAVLASGTQVLPVNLALPAGGPDAPAPSRGFNQAKAAAIQHFERAFIEALLREHGGNVTRAARASHQDRRVLGRLIKKHQIDRGVA